MRALLRYEERERRLAKERHDRRKPPSRDGLKPKPKPHQKKSKPLGGQSGHQGHALQHVEQHDEVLMHRPERGEECQHERETVAGQLCERRHIRERSEVRLQVIEHRGEAMCYLAC